MTFRNALCAAALLSLLPLNAFAQAIPTPAASPHGQPVTLRYQWTPGETRRYTLTMDTSVALPAISGGKALSVNGHQEMLMTQTCQAVRARDGAATLLTRMDSTTATLNGKPMSTTIPGMEMFKEGLIALISPAGKPLLVQTNSAKGAPPRLLPLKALSQMLGLLPAAFPETALKPGDTWSSTVDVNSALGGVMRLPQITLLQTLKDLRTENGATLADISLAIDSPLNTTIPLSGAQSGTASALSEAVSGKTSGTGLLVFDVTHGALVRFTNIAATHITITPPSGMSSSPVSSTMTMQMRLDRAP